MRFGLVAERDLFLSLANGAVRRVRVDICIGAAAAAHRARLRSSDSGHVGGRGGRNEEIKCAIVLRVGGGCTYPEPAFQQFNPKTGQLFPENSSLSVSAEEDGFIPFACPRTQRRNGDAGEMEVTTCRSSKQPKKLCSKKS